MKQIKTFQTNPELCIIGAKCHVLMPSQWIGAYEAFNNGEYNVWIPAKITNVIHSDIDNECPTICVYLRASRKYHTVSVKNMMIFPEDVRNNVKF